VLAGNGPTRLDMLLFRSQIALPTITLRLQYRREFRQSRANEECDCSKREKGAQKWPRLSATSTS
jgi:hypothetical protein